MRETSRSSSRAWWICPVGRCTRWSWTTRACSTPGQARRALWRTKTPRAARRLDSCLKTRIAHSTMAKSCVECFKFAATEWDPKQRRLRKSRVCYWGSPLAQHSLSTLCSPQETFTIFLACLIIILNGVAHQKWEVLTFLSFNCI